MAKTYKIIFDAKSAIGIALYELNAWATPRSEYEISTVDFVLYHCSADVVDVVTESLSHTRYTIEEEHA